MIGWPVPEGQAQVFALVDGGEAGVHLTEGGMMVPRKSLTLVLGQGAGLEAAGSACAFCSLQATCRYQDHYPPTRRVAAHRGIIFRSDPCPPLSLR